MVIHKSVESFKLLKIANKNANKTLVKNDQNVYSQLLQAKSAFPLDNQDFFDLLFRKEWLSPL